MPKWERRDVVVRTNATGHELTAPVFLARGRQERPPRLRPGQRARRRAAGECRDPRALRAARSGSRSGAASCSSPASTRFPRTSRSATTSRASTTSCRGPTSTAATSTSPVRPVRLRRPATSTSTRSRPLTSPRPSARSARTSASRSRRRSTRSTTETRTWGADARLEFALAIQRMAVDADLVLDLHTGDRAPRYLYSPEGSVAAARAFGLPFVLEVPARFGGALDEASFVPWQDLADAFRRLGRNVVPASSTATPSSSAR